MGLDDRDYARNDRRTATAWSPDAGGSVTKRIIVITGLVYLAQILVQPAGQSVVTEWLALVYPAVQQGQVWRMVTYAFCHSTRDLLHIVFNMFILWWTGQVVEALYGGREFLRFYLLAAVAAALAYIGLGLAMGRVVGPMLGASGCTMACFAVFALHYPRAKVFLFGILPVEARWLLVGYVFLDMRPVLLELTGRGISADGIAHSAHLGGLAFGLWYKWSGTRISHWFGWWDNWRTAARDRRRVRSHENVRLYEPPSREELEQRVDALLDKIREQGEGSLTDAEREFLKDASRHYRGR